MRPFTGLERATSDHDRCAAVCIFGRAIVICAALVRDPVIGGVTDFTSRLLSNNDTVDLNVFSRVGVKYQPTVFGPF